MNIPKHLAAQEVLFATLNSISDVETFEYKEDVIVVNGVEFDIYCLFEDGEEKEIGIGDEKEFENLKEVLKMVIDGCWDNKEGWNWEGDWEMVEWKED